MTDQRRVISNEFTKIDQNQPMNETNLWLWMSQWTVSSVPYQSNTKTVIAYLEEVCGFDYTKHIISEEDSEMMRIILNHWYRMNPWFEPHSLAQLVKLPSTVSMKEGERQLLTTGDATPLLLDLVQRSHWIYAHDITDDNTYFVLQERKLYAVAQQILAKRYLCEVTV